MSEKVDVRRSVGLVEPNVKRAGFNRYQKRSGKLGGGKNLRVVAQRIPSFTGLAVPRRSVKREPP